MRITLSEKGTPALRRELPQAIGYNYHFKCSRIPTAVQAAELQRLPWVNRVVLDGSYMGLSLADEKLPSDCQDALAEGHYARITKLVKTATKSW